MLKSPLFKSFFVTLVCVGILEVVATVFHLFLTITWFDMVMHFSGGFLIGMSSLWILTWNMKIPVTYGKLLLVGILSSFVVGVCWEFFELYFGMTSLQSFGYVGDNGMDIVMDTLGGLVSVLFSHIKMKYFSVRYL